MVKSLYDLMAYIIRALVDNTDEQFYEKYLAIIPQKSENINKDLSKKFPEFIENGNAKNNLEPNYLNKNLENRILEFVDSCIIENKKEMLVRFVSKLDSGLAWSVENLKVDSDEFRGLNRNDIEQGIQLLPQCFSSWGHKNKDKTSSNTLNNFMNHLYYVDTRKLYDSIKCTVSHRILSAYNFSNAIEKGYLSIGITPLCDTTKLLIDMRETEEGYGGFQINGLSNIDELVENAVSILEQARNSGVDILCFPEMLGNQKIIQAIRDVLQIFPEAGAAPNPVLTFCPSCWKKKANVVTVLDDKGEKVSFQGKNHRFPYSKDGMTYIEDIEPDYHIQVLHCDGIGRIGIMICKDALNRNYLQTVLNLLKITLLIVPSFSTGFYDFETNLETCKSFDCNVVWINTCSAKKTEEWNSSDIVGFVLKTGKEVGMRNGKYSLKKSMCKKMMGMACRECLYIQKLYFAGMGYK